MTEAVKRRQEALAMPFSSFRDRYINDTRYENSTRAAIANMVGCPVEEADNVLMRELVKFSSTEWLKCDGYGKKALSILWDAYDKACLDFCMSVEDIGPQAEEPTVEENAYSIFAKLQEEMIANRSEKMEFKMLRPDGYTWVLTVLPPNHEDGLKKD